MKWTKRQRGAASARMKLAYQKKKDRENCLSPDVAKPIYQQAAVDTEKLAEFQYRRGLVTAMECILRELR